MKVSFNKKYYEIKINGEITIPIISIIFATSYYFQIKNLSYKSLIFSKPILFLLFLISFFVLITNGIKIKKINQYDFLKKNGFIKLTLKKSKFFNLNKNSYKVLFFFLVILFFMKSLGYMITMFLGTNLLMYFLNKQKYNICKAFFVSILTIFLIYILFQRWLHVPLPLGLIEGCFY